MKWCQSDKNNWYVEEEGGREREGLYLDACLIVDLVVVGPRD